MTLHFTVEETGSERSPGSRAGLVTASWCSVPLVHLPPGLPAISWSGV